jgi:hypothetical protein
VKTSAASRLRRSAGSASRWVLPEMLRVPPLYSHCIEHRSMLADAEILVRAPDCNLAVDALIEDVWKPTTAPFRVCEDPITPSLRSPSKHRLKTLSYSNYAPTLRSPLFQDA